MACPYFFPTRELVEIGFAHPQRLPLGSAWQGCCNAPGHNGILPTQDELKNGCNLGYARGCSRLPLDRPADSVRFAIARERSYEIEIRYVYERNHAPGEHGVLQFRPDQGSWTTQSSSQLAHMAQCFLQSYLRRREGRWKDNDGRPGNT